jgi:hypothetical protein
LAVGLRIERERWEYYTCIWAPHSKAKKWWLSFAV